MSEVQFETLVAPACASEKPKTGSFVTYHYICRDESGNRIDSTYDENAPIHAKIGSGNIIQVCHTFLGIFPSVSGQIGEGIGVDHI